MRYCEDCGTKLQGHFCPNCHEEVFIEQQYEELEMSVPTVISEKAEEIRMKNPESYLL